jgi:acetylornithine deacetylase/succinyl-diaminopimelate desuccinylase-like protein
MNAHSSSRPSAETIAHVRHSVAKNLPQTRAMLDALARIPSVSWPSFDQTQVVASAQFVAQAARDLGIFDQVDIVREPTESGELGQPAVIARRHPRNGAKTVLLYAHHDVQPPGDLNIWETDPFVPTEKGERLYGRGVADDKAGVVSHFAALSDFFSGEPDADLGIVLFIEGEEEYGSPSFEATLSAHRDTLAADVIIVADSGNWSTEVPALTVSLRGNATLKVTVKTLDHALHSGMFGGAVPDAMLALTQLLARLHDNRGVVAVPGLVSAPASVPEFSEEQLRLESGVLASTELIGEGPLLSRIWNQPSITVIGIDAPATSEASNTLLPSVSAVVSLRVAPGEDSVEAAKILAEFLATNPPFGAEVTVETLGTGAAFSMDSTHPVVALAKDSMHAAWDVDPVDMGVGGSIPFIASFVAEFPEAVVLVTGIEDPDTRAHSPNESLHLPSFEKAIVTEALFLREINRSR